jgi:hypothetical protein
MRLPAQSIGTFVNRSLSVKVEDNRYTRELGIANEMVVVVNCSFDGRICDVYLADDFLKSRCFVLERGWLRLE